MSRSEWLVILLIVAYATVALIGDRANAREMKCAAAQSRLAVKQVRLTEAGIRRDLIYPDSVNLELQYNYAARITNAAQQQADSICGAR